jgi:DNA-binding response OmpR family regulator
MARKGAMGSAVHVLLVEDEPLLLMSVEDDLQEAGFDVVSCPTGRERDWGNWR